MARSHDFWVVIYPTEDVTLKDLQTECQKENWAPVLVLRHEGKTFVPMFRRAEVCQAFIKRNLPEGVMCGVMGASEVDTKTYTDKGWIIEWLDYPKLFTSRPGWSIEVEPVESDFELTVHRPRHKGRTSYHHEFQRIKFLNGLR